MKATVPAILNFLMGAFALPVAKAIGLRWTRLMVWPLPKEERDRQLAEYAADIENEFEHNLRSGREPTQVATTLLIRNVFGAPGDIVEASTLVIQRLASIEKENMFMNILVGVALVFGALLGAAGWLNGPNPETGLHMYIVAGIVGVGVGIATPVAVIDALLGD